MTKYESILNALSASKNTFSEEDLLNLYELLLHAYAKGTPARGTIWNVILRDPRLSQFKEKLVKQFLWEYKELLERFLRAYNTPPPFGTQRTCRTVPAGIQRTLLPFKRRGSIFK